MILHVIVKDIDTIRDIILGFQTYACSHVDKTNETPERKLEGLIIIIQFLYHSSSVRSYLISTGILLSGSGNDLGSTSVGQGRLNSLPLVRNHLFEIHLLP